MSRAPIVRPAICPAAQDRHLEMHGRILALALCLPRAGRVTALGYHGGVLAAWGLLEWFFALLLIGLTGAVGLAFLYMVWTLFVNPGRRKRSV